MIFLYILLGLILGLSIFCLYLLARVSKLRLQVLFLYKAVVHLEDAVVADWKKKIARTKTNLPPPPRQNPFNDPSKTTLDIRHLQEKLDKVVSISAWRSKKGKK